MLKNTITIMVMVTTEIITVMIMGAVTMVTLAMAQVTGECGVMSNIGGHMAEDIIILVPDRPDGAGCRADLVDDL